MQSIKSRICAFIERLSIPKVNYLKTWYFNFRVLPFKDARKMPFVIYGNPDINSLSGTIVFKCPIKRRMVEINVQHSFAPSLQTVDSQICICGNLIIEGPVTIGRGTKILVAHSGTLILGKNTLITDFCNISCWLNVHIGQGAMISHRSQISDSNQHYIIDELSRTIPDCRRPIYIGKNCWVCNSSTIAAGSVLPDSTIVASNSLVNKDLSNFGSRILVGGSPVKLLKRNVIRISNEINERFLFDQFTNNMISDFYLPNDIDLNSFANQQ